MTGMGDDGAQAIRRVRERGGRTIAESAADRDHLRHAERGDQDRAPSMQVLPLGDIPSAIQRLCAG